jgi:hypothetical protein
MEFFKNFTREEIVEYKLLEREIKRLETQVQNVKAQAVAADATRDNAAKLVEQEKKRSDAVLDDKRHDLTKPTSEDIHKMPLRAKYTELTGKPAPA